MSLNLRHSAPDARSGRSGRSGRADADARRLLATRRQLFISANVSWGYRGGDRWPVSHYLLAPPR
jgi:hypothetical protein